MRHLSTVRSRTLGLVCVLGFAGLLFTACGGGGNEATPTRAAPLAQVQETASGYKIRMQINGKQLGVTVDTIAGQAHYEGNDNVLTAEEKELLLAESVRIADELEAQGNVQIHSKEAKLSTLLGLYAESPDDYVHRNYSTEPIPDDRRQAKAITCYEEGKEYTAVWNGSNGSHEKKIKADADFGGNYKCMGRCGAGCKALPYWTKQCMNHDACSHHYKASGGRKDKNCGDEWKAAVDSFVRGVFVCGGGLED
jgi:hypothetical protein